MAVAAPGQLNFEKLRPSNGSRTLADSYEKLAQIGEGTYGQVFMAREIETGEIVALKKILMDKEKEGFPITATREIKILNKLNHPNIVKLKEIVTAPSDHGGEDAIYMVFEYMDHDLAGLTSERRFGIPQIKCYMKQLLIGVHYCHANHVLHRDIKASNLLIDNKGNLKLADFGLARLFSNDPNGKLTNHVVTLWYRAPELLLGTTKYRLAIDMWSVGCIFGELLCGKPILPGRRETEQIEKIYDLCGSPDEDNWPGCSKLRWYHIFNPPKPKVRRIREVLGTYCHDPDALELLERMLTLDPLKRITAKDALLTSFFWNGPLASDPKSLPKYEASHEFQTNQTKQKRLKLKEELAKRQKLQHSQPTGRSQLQSEPNHPNHHNFQPHSAPAPSYHHGGPTRYPTGGEYGCSRGPQGGYRGGPYISQRQGPPSHAKSGMPGQSLRGGSGYDGGGPNSYHQGGNYRGSNGGRYSSSNYNQPYNNGWK